MMHQFDHRWATYREDGNTVKVTAEQKRDCNFTVRPRYWVDKSAVFERLKEDEATTDHTDHNDTPPVCPCRPWFPKWLMGWRDICRATDERTVIASIVPFVGTGDTFLLMFPNHKNKCLSACLLADQNSIVHDYVARQKVSGTHLKYHYKKQLPTLPPSAYTQADIDFIVPRVLELTYTAVDLIPFAEDLWDSADANMRRLFLEQRHGRADKRTTTNLRFDHSNHTNNNNNEKMSVRSVSSVVNFLPPFAFDPDRRALLRAELDARYARLYGLDRDDLRYILDPADLMGADYPSETFRGLKDKETAEYGEYRTRRLVLEAWDRGEDCKGDTVDKY
jgi:hypothetical protein